MTTTTTGTCTTCGGKGYLIRARAIGRGQFVRDDEICPTCHGDQPTPPAGRIEIAGHVVDAPGFRDARQFDAAVGRAFADGLQVIPAATGFAVVNPRNGAIYHASRTRCTCPAGERGIPCKHRAAVCFETDVMHSLPTADTAA